MEKTFVINLIVQFEAQRQAEARKAQAEADRFAKEQEAEGIRAVGEAESCSHSG